MALEITNDNYQSVLEQGKPVVVDFGAPWCGPCQGIAPIVEDLAEVYKDRVIVGKCDIDNGGDDLAIQYGIRNIPTILFLKDGKVVDKHVGSITRDALAAKIDALL